MIKKSMQNRGFNYDSFENPYFGLVAMIFVQAQSDLEELNGEDRDRDQPEAGLHTVVRMP